MASNPFKGECECGHNGCFHKASVPFFGGNDKACTVKGCECLRFTAKGE